MSSLSSVGHVSPVRESDVVHVPTVAVALEELLHFRLLAFEGFAAPALQRPEIVCRQAQSTGVSSFLAPDGYYSPHAVLPPLLAGSNASL